MNPVKRYSPAFVQSFDNPSLPTLRADMQESCDGDYVRFDDYSALAGADKWMVSKDVLEAMRQIVIANYDAEDRCRQIAEVIESIQTGDKITFEPLDE